MASLSSSSSSSSTLTSFDRTETRATPMGSTTNQARKVRVVAKIRGFSERDEAGFQEGVSWISVNKPDGEASKSVTVSFGDHSASRKDSYEIDYCYEQNEGNDLVFSREVKPLVSGVFDGCNATVFAYGAKSTGKTSVIQGSCEKPGLAALAMAEILSAAEESGKSVAISFFEVCQDRVFDLLDSKQQAVFVLEDKQGKIQLKGLSRVPVWSISDFQKFYVGQSSSKPPQKTAIELPRRTHKGLIIYISSPDGTLRMGKMNFVELAGYEDVRRKSTDGHNFSEQSKTNTSVYAFLNVIHALSTNISHVPYRESKLARILQDSLGRFHKVLMITCLSPTFCQDSLYMVKLASRSSQKTNSVVLDSTKKIHNLTRPKMVSSIKSRTPKTVSASTKKLGASQLRVPLSEKKVNGVVSIAVKGRKLFDEKSKSTPSDKNTSTQTESSVLDDVSVVKPPIDEEVNSVENVTGSTVSSGYENALTDVPKQTKPTLTTEKDKLPSDSENSQFTFMLPKDVTGIGADEPEAITPNFDINTKTNPSSLVQEGQVIENTLPISARLRELSNNLKALCSATPFSLETAEKSKANVLFPIEAVEPKTPMTDRSVPIESSMNVNSPWQTLSVRSTGMKNSIVHEYLKFLNTADKEELKRLKGIGEKRATWILELREESPEPFKSVDDLKNIGLAGKQINEMVRMDGPIFD